MSDEKNISVPAGAAPIDHGEPASAATQTALEAARWIIHAVEHARATSNTPAGRHSYEGYPEAVARALLSLSGRGDGSYERSTRDARQHSVAEWCAAAFGAGAASSLPQRGIRLLEEAVELYQAAGGGKTMAHLLLDFVFDRPPGRLAKEIGQVGLVLLSMAEAAGVSADEEEAREVARVREKPLSHYAARNQAKNAAGFDTAAEGK